MSTKVSLMKKCNIHKDVVTNIVHVCKVTSLLYFVLSVFLASTATARARVDIVVFDYVSEAGLDQPWAALALTDYSIKLINRTGSYRAMPREQLRRLANRWNRGKKVSLSFETKDALRQFLGASALIEGRLEQTRTGFSFIGTLINPDTGIIDDISFNIKKFSIAEAQTLLARNISAAIDVKLPEPDDVSIVGTDNNEAYVKYWKALYAYENNETQKALILARESESSDENYIEPSILIGRIYLEKTELSKAEAKFKSVAETAPSDPRAYFWSGFTDFLSRKYGAAEHQLKKAIDIDSGNPEYYHQLGLLYSKTFEYSKAVDIFLTAVDIDPSLAETWYEIAAIYSRMKKGTEAVEYAGKAVEWGGRPMIVRLKNDSDFGWLSDNPKFLWILKSE